MSELDEFTVSKWDSEDLPNHRSFQDIFGLREAFNIRGCKSADQRWLGVFDAGDPAGKKTIVRLIFYLFSPAFSTHRCNSFIKLHTMFFSLSTFLDIC